MKKIALVHAVLLVLCIFLAAPAMARERISVGSASFEIPDGFRADDITDGEIHYYVCDKGDAVIGYSLNRTQTEKPYYATSGELIDLINSLVTGNYKEYEIISVGGECAALHIEYINCDQVFVFNRYDVIGFEILGDNRSQYVSSILLSFRITEMPLQ